MILGLDVSTSIVGATILDGDGNIIYCEAWDLRNKKKFSDLHEKASEVRELLKTLKEKYTFDSIFIEQSLQAFRPGFSSAKTLLTLAKFNGIVSYLCYDVYNIKPEYIGASSARKLCGVTVPRGKKGKEVVLNFLLDNEPSFDITYTKFGNPTPGTYDRADSLVVARAGLALCQKNEK